MKRLVSTLLILLAASSLFAQHINPNYVDGVIYFQLKASYPIQSLSWNDNDGLQGEDLPFFTEMFKKYEVNQVLRPFHLFSDEGLMRILEIRFDRAQDIDSFVVELQQNEWVNYAEKVPLMRTAYKPNDPYYGSVKGLNWKWHLDMIKADSAWDVQRGIANIKVAVVDNFVWEGHPDLQIDSANACTVCYDRKQGGYYYSVGTSAPPTEIVQESSEAAYSASHGTHCAGLVGATNNNGKGVASIGGGVTLIGVAASSAQYPQYVLYGLQGLQWAVEHGAKVVSMSFGSSSSSKTYEAVAQTCYNNGIVLVASAGNDGDEDNEILYPAGMSTVISVASVDGDGKLSYFSQWGSGRADIAAPGGFISSNNGKVSYPNILSTTFCESYLLSSVGFANTYYDGMQGTSMATPIVSGLIGLMLSKDSTLKPAEIKTRLQRTATPLNTASEHTIDGYGYINAYKALLDEYLMISADTLIFSKEAGEKDSLLVTASGKWSLLNLPSWLSASVTSGDSGKTTVYFSTLTENLTSANRVVNLTFKGVGKMGSKTFVVEQKNYPFILRIHKKQVLFSSSKGLYDTLCVYATVPWSMKNDANWLASDIQQINNDSSIIVLGTRSNNTWGKNRDVYLIFSSDFLPQDTVYVLQRVPDFLNLSASQINIGATKGEEASIEVFSNVNWCLSGGDSAWILPDKTFSADTDCIVFTTRSDNATGDYREVTYTIKGGNVSKNFIVKQAHNLSVIETEQSEWAVFPNPMSAQLICRFSKIDKTEVRLYDAQGRLLDTFAVVDGELQIDCSNYATGVYLLKYGNSTRKVIKK